MWVLWWATWRLTGCVHAAWGCEVVRLCRPQHQIQRTPIVNRTMQHIPPPAGWRPQNAIGPRQQQRQPFGGGTDYSYRSATISERSDSANEVENMIGNHPIRGASTSGAAGWGMGRTHPSKPASKGELSVNLHRDC